MEADLEKSESHSDPPRSQPASRFELDPQGHSGDHAPAYAIYHTAISLQRSRTSIR